MRLIKASRRERKLMLQTLGYTTMRQFEIDQETRPGTPGRMLAWLESIRGVRSARLTRGVTGVVVPMLTLCWWTWLFFGWWHRRVLRRANQIVMSEKPAGADFTVGFEP